MKHKLKLLTALAALPLMMAGEAQAGDRCKSYTTTIRIGGQAEIGVGKACERERNVWEIVNVGGSPRARDYMHNYIYDSLHDDNYRVIVVNNYDLHRRSYRPAYRPAYYGFYAPARHYHDRHRGHHKRYDHRGHRGHGKGHDKHKGHGGGKGRH